MESIKKYKFIHIFFHNEIIYSKKLVNMIVDSANGFNAQEHGFATYHQKVYDEFKGVCNIEFFEHGKKNPAKMINELAERCDYMFFHSLCSPSKFLGVKDKYLSKIVWRTWGHDAYGVQYHKEKKLGNFVKKLLRHKSRWNKKIAKIKAVGCAGIVDVINLSPRFPSLPMISFPYLDEISEEDFNALKTPIEKKDKTVRVILGHSTAEVDNHRGMLIALQKFANEDIKVYMPMTYGWAPYIAEIEEFIKKENITCQTEILKDMMSYSEYVNFIKRSDILILDGQLSYALGNIYLALIMGKKVFLNKDGIIKKAFDLDNIPCETTDRISEMDFEEFKKPFKYDATSSTLALRSPKKSVQEWHDILKWLNGDDIELDLSKKLSK